VEVLDFYRSYKRRKKNLINRIYDRVKPPNMRGYYGQFAEDAALQTYFIDKMWAATGNWEVKNNGFYVDIGAYSPVLISNTYWFYQHGWRGINVEPFPDIINKFNTERPQDINVSLAIGSRAGLNKYYSWGNSSMNTFSADKVASYIRDGKVSGEPTILEIEMIKLETLLDRHLPDGVLIDFITVDVEGMDLDVLSSNDWRKYRPRLVSVELDCMNINDVIHSDLYSFMLSKGYELYYWLNPAVIFVDKHS